MLAAFKKQGFYTTFKGEKIYQQDFKHVYVAGGTAPLSWDFDNLANKPELELKDPDGDGIYEATLTLNQPAAAKTTAAQLEKDHQHRRLSAVQLPTTRWPMPSTTWPWKKPAAPWSPTAPSAPARSGPASGRATSATASSWRRPRCSPKWP